MDAQIAKYLKTIMSLEDKLSKLTVKQRELEFEIKYINDVINRHRASIFALLQENGVMETSVLGFRVLQKKCSTIVEIIDESKIPKNLIKTSMPVAVKSPDKVTIKQLLKDGHEVAGCKLSDDKYELEIKGK